MVISKKALAAADRVFDILDTKADVVEKEKRYRIA